MGEPFSDVQYSALNEGLTMRSDSKLPPYRLKKTVVGALRDLHNPSAERH